MRETEPLELWAPPEYWNATQEERDAVVGGCGPGGFGDILVPDTMYGLSVKPACAIHDWMYAFGETDQDKIDADEVFQNNMLRIIDIKSKSRILRFARRFRSLWYFFSVKFFGGPAFWDGKNKPEELKVIEEVPITKRRQKLNNTKRKLVLRKLQERLRKERGENT